MRKGHNPNKDKPLSGGAEVFHKMIIPVHIPNETGYFKDALAILKLCLNSIFKTTHPHTNICIVNDGSCEQVYDYITQLYEDKQIVEVYHTKTNIGKLNAILKAVAGSREPLITISDADVLFLENWQNGVYSVFNNFPKAGAVCTTPSSKSYHFYTGNIWWSHLLSSKLRFTSVKDPEALRNFAKSVDNTALYKAVHLKKYLTMSKGEATAVVGAGHFTCTYRREIFDNLSKTYSEYALGGRSEQVILDEPVIKNGLWRLSTTNNYTRHMGNNVEPWMPREIEIIQPANNNFSIPKSSRQVKKINFITYSFYRVIHKALRHKRFVLWLLVFKGLTKKEAKAYLE